MGIERLTDTCVKIAASSAPDLPVLVGSEVAAVKVEREGLLVPWPPGWVTRDHRFASELGLVFGLGSGGKAAGGCMATTRASTGGQGAPAAAAAGGSVATSEHLSAPDLALSPAAACNCWTSSEVAVVGSAGGDVPVLLTDWHGLRLTADVGLCGWMQ